MIDRERLALMKDIDKLSSQIEDVRPMVEAYRLWATGRMDASRFGGIADRAVLFFDRWGGK